MLALWKFCHIGLHVTKKWALCYKEVWEYKKVVVDCASAKLQYNFFLWNFLPSFILLYLFLCLMHSYLGTRHTISLISIDLRFVTLFTVVKQMN
ncbi:hypothetical protein HanIR_Chr14g0714181 [Helianthus annuus]|nr:hypothetical protein HanIR_Chr14g0714181 [Helianthus annuus]